MKKHITDEKTGISYTLHGDYYLPDLTLPEQREIGVWGERHHRYLREHRHGIYSGLLLSGKLNAYLAEIDEQAAAMYERLTTQMAEREGITEALKESDQMAWVGAMNNIRQRATEIVNSELIYA